MPFRHVVVDGSNIATEGRSLPSLGQLDDAVRAFRKEYPAAEITVVVDATFAHRIEEEERATFDEAESHNELVSPPAGAIGRGDAFLLRIAEKTGATVLSNDSFQEFHGEHEWLFDDGRLIGGKPVPGVGWIFTPRTPVRGVKSRKATKKAGRTVSKEALHPLPTPRIGPPRRPATGRPASKKARAAAKPASKKATTARTPAKRANARGGATAAGGTRGQPVRVRRAIAAATEEAVAPERSGAPRSRRRSSGPPPHAVNEPLTFITFIADHPLGSLVDGEVESFTSHGAFVSVGAARCYVPLAGLGVPPPRSARQVLERGSQRTFVLQALDPQRRGIELALPEAARVAGIPSEETVNADMEAASAATGPASRSGARRSANGEAPARRKAAPNKARAPKATAKQSTAKTSATRKAAPKKAAASKPSTKKTSAKRSAPKRLAAKKAPAESSAAKKEATKRRAVAKTASGGKAAGAAKRAPAKAMGAKRAGPAAPRVR